jgi:hypothetical protein
MRMTTIGRWLLLGASLIVPLVSWSQDAQQKQTLIVNGQPGEMELVQIEGRSYVDVAALAQNANGSISFRGNQTVLTLPNCPPRAAAAAPAAAAPPMPAGLSKEFIKAGIEEMAVIREWRSAVVSSIQRGLPVTDMWVAGLRDSAIQNLRLASLAVNTDDDRNAYQSVTNEYNFMKQLSDQLVESGNSMTVVTPGDLANNPLNQKIVSCGHSLGAMAANGRFSDDGACQ